MVTPSAAIVSGTGEVTRYLPCAIADNEDSAPFAAVTLATRASLLRSTNFGNAIADKIPRMTITITSSISVKPDCFFE